jgi:FMN phosphatase YigB (HAD superfamily)
MDIRIKNNLKPDEIIFFGDSKTDIEAAFYHNVQIIIRMHKHNSNYFNSNHHKIIRDFSEIEMFKMNQNN